MRQSRDRQGGRSTKVRAHSGTVISPLILTVLLSGLSQHRGDVAILDDGNIAPARYIFDGFVKWPLHRRQYRPAGTEVRARGNQGQTSPDRPTSAVGHGETSSARTFLVCSSAVSRNQLMRLSGRNFTLSHGSDQARNRSVRKRASKHRQISRFHSTRSTERDRLLGRDKSVSLRAMAPDLCPLPGCASRGRGTPH